MSIQSNAMPGSSLQSQIATPAAISATHRLYWSVRRELWENRSLYIAPLAAAAVFLFGFLINLIVLLLSSVVLMGSGLGVTTLWTHASFFHVSLMLLYHLVTVHGLWYAPMYGWLFFVSALAPRAPFIWAFLPPFVICGVEKIAFNTSYVAAMLLHRLSGPEAPTPPGSTMMDVMAALTPLRF